MRMSSEPARSPSLSPAKGSLSPVREDAKGSLDSTEGLLVGVASMPDGMLLMGRGEVGRGVEGMILIDERLDGMNWPSQKKHDMERLRATYQKQPFL